VGLSYVFGSCLNVCFCFSDPPSLRFFFGYSPPGSLPFREEALIVLLFFSFFSRSEHTGDAMESLTFSLKSRGPLAHP